MLLQQGAADNVPMGHARTQQQNIVVLIDGMEFGNSADIHQLVDRWLSALLHVKQEIGSTRDDASHPIGLRQFSKSLIYA
jgi:hypothetical protein